MSLRVLPPERDLAPAGEPLAAARGPAIDVSLCIVNYKATEFLVRCLRSIAEAPPTSGLQSIIVDNATPGFDRETVLAEMKDATILENDSNLGYAAACNQAIELSLGEFVLLCNPDIEFRAGTIDKLRAFLAEHRDAAGAAPQLVYPSGRIQASSRGFPDPSPLLFEITGLARLFPRSRKLASYRMRYFDHATTREVEQPMASCLMLWREAIEDIGPLDEQFPIFYNDVDWAIRAAERGWKMFFVAEARALHHYGQSTKHMGSRRAFESARSLVRLYRKHYRRKIPAVVYYPMVALIASGGFMRGVGVALKQTLLGRA